MSKIDEYRALLKESADFTDSANKCVPGMRAQSEGVTTGGMAKIAIGAVDATGHNVIRSGFVVAVAEAITELSPQIFETARRNFQRKIDAALVSAQAEAAAFVPGELPPTPPPTTQERLGGLKTSSGYFPVTNEPGEE